MASAIAVLALAGCQRGPQPADVRATIAADATAAASADLGAVLAWGPIGRDRARFLGRDLEALARGAEGCGLDLTRTRLTASWNDREANLVLAGPAAGRGGLLSCVGEAAAGGVVWIGETDGGPALQFADRQWRARGIDRDTLRIWSHEGGDDQEPGAMGLAEDAALAGLIARGADRLPLWFATADPEATTLSESVAVAAALHDAGADVVVDGPGDGEASGRASRLRAALASWSARIYLPAVVAERLEVDTDDALHAEVTLATAEAFSVDLRWLAGGGSQPIGPQPAPADPRSVFARVFGPDLPTAPEPVEAIPTVAPAEERGDLLAGGRFVKLGVPACDDYIEFYATCIDDKLPEATRKVSLDALSTAVDAWRKVLETPGTAEVLAKTCETAADAMRPTCA